MRRVLLVSVLVAVAIFATSCSHDQPTAPENPTLLTSSTPTNEQLAANLFSLAGWEIEDPETLPDPDPVKCFGWIVDYQRIELVDQIVHYRWDIQMSMAEQDVITLHRVVKERHNRPIRTRLNLFLQHGDAKDFQGMFLPGTLSETTPVEFGAAIYWAQRNVDVWGIDQAWNNVPAETSDFGFMADWGIDKQARDLGRAVAIARLARRASGNGFGKMNLLGYSSGSATGYALLNEEAQRPPGLRQVGAWIPVDYSPVTDIPEWNESSNCATIPELQGYMDNGEYGYFVGFDLVGTLGRFYPDDDSPVVPGMTNIQVAMYFGAAPLWGWESAHYLAGVWENEFPVDFVHVTVDQWLDFAIAGAPWEPVAFMMDYSVWGCGEIDVPWDDHFSDITVPVLNLGADGGIGPTTHYCPTLLGSTDVTEISVGLLSPEEALFDIGHIDLFIADVAPEMVWQPILEWVDDHTPGNGNHGHHSRN